MERPGLDGQICKLLHLFKGEAQPLTDNTCTAMESANEIRDGKYSLGSTHTASVQGMGTQTLIPNVVRKFFGLKRKFL